MNPVWAKIISFHDKRVRYVQHEIPRLNILEQFARREKKQIQVHIQNTLQRQCTQSAQLYDVTSKEQLVVKSGYVGRSPENLHFISFCIIFHTVDKRTTLLEVKITNVLSR